MNLEKNWLKAAVLFLNESLKPLPHELNELDWKLDISSKGEQSLSKHISAFANHSQGGYLVFGVNDEGQVVGIDQSKIKTITCFIMWVTSFYLLIIYELTVEKKVTIPQGSSPEPSKFPG